MKHIKTLVASGIMLSGLCVAGLAVADSKESPVEEEAEIRAFLNSKVTVARAAAAAEQKAHGRAMSVEFEEKNGQHFYEVEVVTKDGKEMEVKVHANTGAVLSVEHEDATEKDED